MDTLIVYAVVWCITSLQPVTQEFRGGKIYLSTPNEWQTVCDSIEFNSKCHADYHIKILEHKAKNVKIEIELKTKTNNYEKK